MKVVAVSVDKLKFKKAIKPGSMVEINEKATKVGKVKIDIKVEKFVEKSDSGLREKAVEANFTFAVINDKGKPIFINWKERVEHELYAYN